MRAPALLAAATAALALAAARPAAAQPLANAPFVTDQAGDFLSSYTAAPQNGDVDVVGIQAVYDGTSFRLFSRSAGVIGTTPGALFVWGFNRGQGTARFAALGITNVLFDAVAVINPGAGTITVNDLLTGASSGPLVGGVRSSGTDLTGTFAASLLPTLAGGFAPSAFTVNLWPRVGTGNNNQISDFAPNNSNIGVAVIPEPATALLLAPALGAVAVAARRRRRA